MFCPAAARKSASPSRRSRRFEKRRRASTTNIRGATRRCSSTASRSISRSRGSRWLLPSFLEAFNRIVDAETSNIDILLRPYTQNQLHLQRELWAERKGTSAVVISPGGTDLANLAEKQTLVPVILLNRTLPNYSYVGFDQLESGRLAAEHALKRGGDSILLVSSPTLFGTSWRSSAFPTTACSTA